MASDLTDEDYTDLAALVREAIDAEPYRIGPRMSKLKRLLARERLGALGTALSFLLTRFLGVRALFKFQR